MSVSLIIRVMKTRDEDRKEGRGRRRASDGKASAARPRRNSFGLAPQAPNSELFKRAGNCSRRRHFGTCTLPCETPKLSFTLTVTSTDKASKQSTTLHPHGISWSKPYDLASVHHRLMISIHSESPTLYAFSSGPLMLRVLSTRS